MPTGFSRAISVAYTVFKRTFTVFLMLGLLATNVMSLTWEAFQVAASGLLSAASIPTLYDRKVQADRQKKLLVKQAGANIRKRTLKSAAVNVGSMAGEAIPYAGLAVIVGATGYELKLACENLLDLEHLYSDLGIDDEADRSAVEKVCDPQLPEAAGDLSDWARDLFEFSNDPDSDSAVNDGVG